jgi:hypothetical protein
MSLGLEYMSLNPEDKEFDDYGTYHYTESMQHKKRTPYQLWHHVDGNSEGGFRNAPWNKCYVDCWGKYYLIDQKKYDRVCFLRNSARIVNHPNYLGFRSGPVPNTGSYGGCWWHPYRCKNPVSAKREFCDTVEHKSDAKLLLNECGVGFKVRGKRDSTARMLFDWDGIDRNGGKGRGWKRTRKQKQWM